MAIRSENAVDKFIKRWQSASGSERANYHIFVHELCTLPELPTPAPVIVVSGMPAKSLRAGKFASFWQYLQFIILSGSKRSNSFLTTP